MDLATDPKSSPRRWVTEFSSILQTAEWERPFEPVLSTLWNRVTNGYCCLHRMGKSGRKTSPGSLAPSCVVTQTTSRAVDFSKRDRRLVSEFSGAWRFRFSHWGLRLF